MSNNILHKDIDKTESHEPRDHTVNSHVDVITSGLVNNNLLVYRSSSQTWVNASFEGDIDCK